MRKAAETAAMIDVQAVVEGRLGLSCDEVVKLTGLCHKTIRVWSKLGKFPAPYVIHGRMHRWDAAEVLAWWKARPRAGPEVRPCHARR